MNHLYSVGFCLILLSTIRCERLKDQITVQLNSGKYDCFTLLNGTHQVGCQSSDRGNSGTTILVTHADELRNNNVNDEGNVIVVANIEHLTRDLVQAFISSTFIRGVILFQNHTNLERKRSEDSSCPNQEFSFYKKSDSNCYEWNREGAIHPAGIRFLDWQKPVFFITNETEIDILVNKCIKAFNLDSKDAKCTAKMSMRMHAAGDAQICLRRQQLFSGLSDSISMCDPLGDENVFAIIPPISKNDTPNIFMLATKLDTFSMFTNNDGGDISILTSLITSLSVANAIGKNLGDFQAKARKNKKQMMFGFFHGESLGYIGSSRMVYDMELGKFPADEKPFSSNKSAHSIRLKDINLYVEIQQVGYGAENKNYYAHYDPKVYKEFKAAIDKTINKATDEMKLHGFKLNKVKGPGSAQVPPSSYHSLLKHEEVPGIIITTANQGFYYKDVNSISDKSLRNDHDRKLRSSVIQHIEVVATSTLYSVLNYVIGEDPTAQKNYSIDQNYVAKLVDCFFYSDNWNCPFFNEMLNITHKADFTKTLYIGTKKEPSFIRILAHALLVNSLGDTKYASNVNNSGQCKSKNEQQNLYYFVWQFDPAARKPHCYRTSIYRTPASSPAFEIENYDFTNGTYSTWVESVWAPRRLELYITTGYSTDLIILVLGIILFVTCLLACRKMNIEAWLDDPILIPNMPEPL